MLTFKTTFIQDTRNDIWRKVQSIKSLTQQIRTFLFLPGCSHDLITRSNSYSRQGFRLYTRSLFPPPQNSVTSPLHWLAKQAVSPFVARVDPAPGAALPQKHWIANCNQSARALFSAAWRNPPYLNTKIGHALTKADTSTNFHRHWRDARGPNW